MPRFFVVDQSLANYQGHHYECSLAVAEAARRAGYEPLILANRLWSLKSEEDIAILPVFTVDWFNQPLRPGEFSKPFGVWFAFFSAFCAFLRLLRPRRTG
jgi:hypothetical protein